MVVIHENVTEVLEVGKEYGIEHLHLCHPYFSCGITMAIKCWSSKNYKLDLHQLFFCSFKSRPLFLRGFLPSREHLEMILRSGKWTSTTFPAALLCLL